MILPRGVDRQCELLNAHPDLKAWMARPTRARLADLALSHAWSFITWCFLEQILVPDLDLLLTNTPGDLYAEWGRRHADDVARVSEIADRYSWSANWTRAVAANALAMVCLWSGNDLYELTDDVFDSHRRARRHSLGPARRPPAQPGPGLQSPPGLLRAADLPPHATQEPTACSHRRRDAPGPPPTRDPQGCPPLPGRRGHDPAPLDGAAKSGQPDHLR